ncbi:Xaa-Pro peptidase family protein [Sphingomonas sp. RG327]|uniref:Xaa-Pro peptidase family protein n=2 Tax=Sphingomonas anseongensis TaxID=2908207 RepID=A0ABT0RE81_9SPHN|nr:Xaa-Pro peptidase family protein [Sphingomonas anseongensis]MCL6678534.1 Xaa-Pro peptidase family protein [Sphingomonas anseongensis]
MMAHRIQRRTFLGSAGAAAAIAAIPFARLQAQAAAELPKIPIPPPISSEERLARIAKARALMQKNGIGAIVVEAGPSLDYFTGVQWWRSERLTAAIIPASGEPIIVTPFFERPSVAESLSIPAEIRTWNEDEEPLKLVADFLKERGVAGQAVGFEETDRFFILDRLKQQLPALNAVSGNPVVRGCRMIKSPAELALMQSANDIMLASLTYAAARTREGMTPAEIDALIAAAQKTLGGSYDDGLILLGEASAYPHGSHKPQLVKRGEVVLMDCTCSVHGYQADITRTYVFGGDPTPEQRKLWDQVHRGQQLAIQTAKPGVPAGAVDDAVRRLYESWGFGPGYRLPGLSHRTGHGIGMEVHEPINLVHGEMTPLAPGMCFSDEPGLYIPGKFGVRLEDCWHMTEAGPKFFTQPPPSIDKPFG